MDANHKNLHTDLVDAVCYLSDIVGDLHETGKTSDTRLDGVANAVKRLLDNVGGSNSSHATPLTDAQIKHMVDRFLTWQIPESFQPDGGISYTQVINAHTGRPYEHGPVGTNLLDAQQAAAMIRHMIDGMPGN